MSYLFFKLLGSSVTCSLAENCPHTRLVWGHKLFSYRLSPVDCLVPIQRCWFLSTTKGSRPEAHRSEYMVPAFERRKGFYCEVDQQGERRRGFSLPPCSLFSGQDQGSVYKCWLGRFQLEWLWNLTIYMRSGQGLEVELPFRENSPTHKSGSWSVCRGENSDLQPLQNQSAALNPHMEPKK